MEKVKVISVLRDIDTLTKEGKMLIAALGKITTESQTDKTPDEVIEQLNKLLDNMVFSDIDPIGGDWNWAQEQMELGYLIRRSCWINKTVVVYAEVDALVVENLSINGTIKGYTPLLVDKEATDWELYIK